MYVSNLSNSELILIFNEIKEYLLKGKQTDYKGYLDKLAESLFYKENHTTTSCYDEAIKDVLFEMSERFAKYVNYNELLNQVKK